MNFITSVINQWRLNMNKKFIKELNQVLEENKKKIKIIEEKKTERSKKYNTEELFLLWAYYKQKIGLSPYLACFDLIRKEYGYIIWKIFGKDFCKFFMEDTNNPKDKKMWNNKSTRRTAVDIVMTYKRRGQTFLKDSLKPKKETELQKKYLMPNCYGFLNDIGIKKVNELINENAKNK